MKLSFIFNNKIYSNRFTIFFLTKYNKHTNV